MRHSAGAWSGKTSEVPAFRMACLAETTAQFLAPERDTFSGTVHVRWCTDPFACAACRITL